MTYVSRHYRLATLAVAACLGLVMLLMPISPVLADETDDLPDNTSTTAVATVDDGTGDATHFNGTIDDSVDVDWVKVSLTAGQMYRFALKGLSSGGDLTLRTPIIGGIHRSNSYRIAGTIGFLGGEGRNARLHYYAEHTGSHWVEIAGLAEEAGTYALRVLEVPDDKQPDNLSTPANIDVRTTETGKIDYRGDQDWFRAELLGGYRYRIVVEGTGWTAPQMALLDHDGYRVPSNTYVYTAGRTAFTPPKTGTYYLRVGSAVNNTGKYSLSLTTRLFAFQSGVTHSLPENTTGSVNTGGAANAGDPARATGPNGDATSYALGGTDAASFTIDATTAQLQTATGLELDYETKDSYEVTLTATDSEGQTAQTDVTIRVLDVNETGTVTFTQKDFNGEPSDELTVNDTLVAALADPDGVKGEVMWRWSYGVNSNGPFTLYVGAFDNEFGAITSEYTDNYFQVTATYTDAHGPDQQATAVTSMGVGGL